MRVLLLMSILFSVQAYAQDTLQFTEIFLKKELSSSWSSDANRTEQSGGFLQKSREEESYNIYGKTAKIVDEQGILIEDSYNKYLGEVYLKVSNYGLILFEAGIEDILIDLSGLDGKSLSKMCAMYGGLGAGGTFVGGGENFAVINWNGVRLHSSTKTIVGSSPIAIDISYAKVEVDCLDKKNLNWGKTIEIVDKKQLEVITPEASIVGGLRTQREKQIYQQAQQIVQQNNGHKQNQKDDELRDKYIQQIQKE